MSKFNKTKEWLIEEYVIKNKSRKEVAENCNLTESGLKSLLIKWDIKKEKINIKESDFVEAVNKKLNAKELAQMFNCSLCTIYKYCKLYKVVILADPDIKNQYDDTNDEEICDLYLNGFSTTEIAKEFNTTHSTIIKHLEHCGVIRRTLSESQFLHNNKQFPEDLKSFNIVYDLYINQKMSKKDLGIKYNVDPSVIDRILKYFNIPIRSSSESKINLMSGPKHPNWKGGVTSLYRRLREFFKVQQVPKILKRDNYCCTLCGSKSTLHVHHIKPFKDIFYNILENHPELTLKNNSEELYQIAIKDENLCDLNNLITYCKECHFYKIHNYSKKVVCGE